MYFYKETLEDNTYRYVITNLKRTEPYFEEITQEEYESATAWEWEETPEIPPELPTDEISPDEFLQLIEEAF